MLSSKGVFLLIHMGTVPEKYMKNLICGNFHLVSAGQVINFCFGLVLGEQGVC